MNKLVTFLLMFILALTVLLNIKNQDFDLIGYVENVSQEFETLEIPSFPTLNTNTTLSRLKQFNGYYFDTTKLYNFIENNNLPSCSLDEEHGHYMSYWDFVYNDKCYVAWVYTTDEEKELLYLPLTERKYYYTENEYNEMPQELKELMVYGSAYDDVDSVSKIFYEIQNFFDIVYNFLLFIWDLLVYLVDLIVYVLKVIYTLGGGLLV